MTQSATLRAKLLRAGVYDHQEVAGWCRLGLLLTALAGCLVLLTALPLWTAVLLVPMAALLTTTAVMFGHEGSHGSFSASPRQNQLLTLFCFPLIGGLGALYWKHKHNGLHHGHPNVRAQDPDVNLWPMVTCQEDFAQASRPRRWFARRLQAYAFWPMSALMGVSMRWSSITHLIVQARRGRVDRAWVCDATALALHYTLWFGAGTLLWGFWGALLIYTALWGTVSVLLALIFAPAHMGLPLVSGQNSDWRHQLETTRNLRTPRGLRWFFVGLDHQVEHHLFPRIPHEKLPRASKIVKAWCQRVGLPHQEVGYGRALSSVTAFMKDAWKTPASDPADLRIAEQGVRR